MRRGPVASPPQYLLPFFTLCFRRDGVHGSQSVEPPPAERRRGRRRRVKGKLRVGVGGAMIGLGGAQLRSMLRKNWLLKKRHPFSTAAEILLPTVVMLLLIGIRTRVDTTMHPVRAYIRKGMFHEVGRSEVSPSFNSILKMLVARGEYLAFSPDSDETRTMIDVLSFKFPLLRLVQRTYKDEQVLENYIRSDSYGINDQSRNLSNPKIIGAIIFHDQGPQLFDYSIRLNHTWAFSGFPDVKTIMDTNGAYVDDLVLGVDVVPTLQYGYSGFLTFQQFVDSFIIFAAQQSKVNILREFKETLLLNASQTRPHSNLYWTQFSPTNIRIAPFPTRAYADDEFQSIIKKVMGVLYLLGFLYPISRLISFSVFEKEQKIKEGLYMMGLKDETFYISWFITYSVQFALSAAIITACTMTSLFLYSDKSLVFTYFFLFSLSAVMLSFLISTFFSRAKTAVAVGTLSFLGAFFPYYTVNDPAIPLLLKALASLLSPTAFALGTVNFADYERAHVGVRWSNMWQASSGVNFLVCMLMMMFDTVLYLVVGLYLDKVLPKENGLRYPWNFLFRNWFSLKKVVIQNHVESTEGKVPKMKKQHSSKVDFESAIEPVSLDMKHQELDGRCIQIRDLHKVFMTRKGECCAVNSLKLNLYENQILALLGHNGAGKSTTISMLVGLLLPTSGDALVFGKNIRTDMDEIRKVLGVCPQYDILFPELTVKEHLEIFGVLKGVRGDLLNMKVTEMVNEVDLADKINTIVGALSGGMKRKLSLGIALIGDSKVIILDEPTSGMDPYSMRSTWQLIKRIKKGRIILLTTHSMDEADVLGDRIAIMSNGSLKCCGSSLFLKHHYGVGYTLTVVKSNPITSIAGDIVLRHVPTATCLSDVGTEISFRLPLASSCLFHNMFHEIESCIKRTRSSYNSRCEDDKHFYGIESYGVSVTTLEEVFLKVAGQTFDEDGENECDPVDIEPVLAISDSSSYIPVLKATTYKAHLTGCLKRLGMICLAMGGVCYFILSTLLSFVTFLSIKVFPCGLLIESTFWRHFKALIIKRTLSARRDRRTVIFQLFIPAVFLFFGLLFLKLKPHPDQYSLTLTTSHFNPLLRGGGGGGPIPFNLSMFISKQISSHVKGSWIQKEKPRAFRFPNPEQTLSDAIEVAGPKLGRDLLAMSEYLITSLNESYQSRYGAVVMDDQHDDGSLGYTVLHNSSCQHGAPTYINLMNAAILRLATGNENMTIRTRNHPLPMTMSQHLQHHDLDAFSASIIISIAFSFIPASFAVAIVKEREVKAKHQQLISGVSILSYWTSTYLWDFFSFLFPSSFAILLLFIFDLNQFIGYGCIVPTILIFLLYGFAVASSTYCLTFFFADHFVAQNVVLLVHFFFGLILMVISFIMGLLASTKKANSFLKSFFRLSPGFCFADGLASLALRRQGLKLGAGSRTLDWNVTGASICYLGIESVVYFLLVLAIEVFSSRKINIIAIKEWCSSRRNYNGMPRNSSEPLLGATNDSRISVIDEDADVQAERDRVLSGLPDNAIISLCNLRKVYYSGMNHKANIAVQSLTFSVRAGECFGFLGTNGAGKTTTLSMLSGEESPTDGTAYIFENDIRMHPKAARKHVGYCPQFDALLEFLTVREHLELYARIKEVPEMRMKDVVDEKLVEFDLWKHEHKPSFSLSGGNKRKLSVAVAMIGDPPIVILDEPSTGMDPIAKRFMWDVISRLSTRQGKTAVILTTHSMNEAQALCTRIGIMVAGRLRCIGSPQHLKTRFGNHIELEVKANEVSSTELNSLTARIQDILFDFPFHTKNILSELEICIGRSATISAENAAEISLSREMITVVARWLGNEGCVRTLLSPMPVADGAFGEQLSEQLTRDGGIPLRIFSEWWLAKKKFLDIEHFILSSFPGATFDGCNGLSIKYQLPYGEDSSLADIFGHLELNRETIGIQEYSVSQSTLETIFNHFAASHHVQSN